MKYKAMVYNNKNELLGKSVVENQDHANAFANSLGSEAKRMEMCTHTKPMFGNACYYVAAVYTKNSNKNIWTINLGDSNNQVYVCSKL